MFVLPFTTSLWILSTIVSILAAICWSFPFILIKWFNYDLYHITDRETINLFVKLLNIKGTINKNNKEYGIFCGISHRRPYVGKIGDKYSYDSHKDEMDLYIMCPVNLRNQIIKNLTINGNRTVNNSIEDLLNKEANAESNAEFNTEFNAESNVSFNTSFNKLNDNQLNIYIRKGSYTHFDYKSKPFNIHINTPYKSQQTIIDNIEQIYNQKNIARVLIYGQPGLGKSLTALFLANKLQGSICSTFNFCDPGDGFHTLYEATNPEEKKPLVLLIDEIDVHLTNIVDNKVKHDHHYSPVEVYNKNTWNNFFDNFDWGFYNYVIIIMTSNKNKEYFDNLDPSYLRPGRVDAIYELKN